jgi:hypothetical protein
MSFNELRELVDGHVGVTHCHPMQIGFQSWRCGTACDDVADSMCTEAIARIARRDGSVFVGAVDRVHVGHRNVLSVPVLEDGLALQHS